METSKGHIMKTYEKWGKTFRIEFDINVSKIESIGPRGFPGDNVFHFTTGKVDKYLRIFGFI